MPPKKKGKGKDDENDHCVVKDTPKDSDDIPLLRTDGFSKWYGTRILLMRTEYDFRAIVANEKMMDDDGTEFFIGESMFILTPIAAKELNDQLKKEIREWEKEHGKIANRPKKSRYLEQQL